MSTSWILNAQIANPSRLYAKCYPFHVTRFQNLHTLASIASRCSLNSDPGYHPGKKGMETLLTRKSAFTGKGFGR